MLDALVLSRLQFATNISFHILFPTITIALCWYLFYFKLRYDLSGNPVWMRVYRFWVKIFALSFALGVVSGIAMSFQFGTNWPGYMEKVGNIAGPLLGYEVLSAFFLEATFLGVMLFGMQRVPNWLHTLSALFVALGTSLSAFWIIALNSWMQTPAGFEVIDGIVYPSSWWEIIFNPSMPYRLVHMLIASGLTASFLLMGVSAYRLLLGDDKHAPKLTLKTAAIVAVILAPCQALVGDLHGLNSLQHQPQKIAAVEALWHTEQGAPLVLFALPNPEAQRNDFAIEIPYLASIILTHSAAGEVRGLNEFSGQHPPVTPVFFAFRVMVAMGMLMWFVAWLSGYILLRGKPLPNWLLRALYRMTFVGWLATLAGWYVSEIGRQPYIVSGLLTTADAVTQLPAPYVGITLLGYLTLYALLLFAYVQTLFYMAKKSVEVAEYDLASVHREVEASRSAGRPKSEN